VYGSNNKPTFLNNDDFYEQGDEKNRKAQGDGWEKMKAERRAQSAQQSPGLKKRRLLRDGEKCRLWIGQA